MHPYYSKETWQNIYAPYFQLVRGEDQWDKCAHDPILSHEYNKGVGCPKKNRIKCKDVPQNPYK